MWEKGRKREPREQSGRTGAQTLLLCLLLAVAALLAFSYGFINVFRYTAQLDADIASEALNARAIWEYGTLIPENFFPSSETRIVNVNALAALLYGLTGSMKLSMGLACTAMMAILLAFYWVLLRRLQLERAQAAAGLCLLLAVPGSLHHAQLLYLFAVYYAVHSIALLASLLVYLRLIRIGGGQKRNDAVGERGPESAASRHKALWLGAAATWLLAFGLGLSGLRAALVCYAPLLLTELLRRGKNCLRQSFASRERTVRNGGGKNDAAQAGTLSGKAYKAAQGRDCAGLLYAAGLCFFCWLGTLSPTAIGVNTTRNLRRGPEKLLGTVLPDLREALTGANAGMARNTLLVILVLAAVAVCGAAVWQIAGKMPRRRSFAALPSDSSKAQETASNRRIVLVFFGISFLLAMVMGAFTTTPSVWRYYYMAYFLISYAAALAMESAAERSKCCRHCQQRGANALAMESAAKRNKGVGAAGFFAGGYWFLAGAVLLFSLLFWREELYPTMKQESRNTDYEAVTAWMEQNGFFYGYSTFESANAMTVYCDGRVQVSAVADLSRLNINKWLSNRSWYVPQLPEAMKTAYIVPAVLEEQFVPVRAAHPDIREALRTEKYIVYAAERNYSNSED